LSSARWQLGHARSDLDAARLQIKRLEACDIDGAVSAMRRQLDEARAEARAARRAVATAAHRRGRDDGGSSGSGRRSAEDTRTSLGGGAHAVASPASASTPGSPPQPSRLPSAPVSSKDGGAGRHSVAGMPLPSPTQTPFKADWEALDDEVHGW